VVQILDAALLQCLPELRALLAGRLALVDTRGSRAGDQDLAPGELARNLPRVYADPVGRYV